MGSGLMALLQGGGKAEKDAPLLIVTIDLLRWKTRDVDIN